MPLGTQAIYDNGDSTTAFRRDNLNQYKIPFCKPMIPVFSETESQIVTYNIPADSA